MTESYPVPRDDAQLVVFDFDHTLYDGDSGSHLFAWLIRRNPLRMLAAVLITPLFGPLVALLPKAPGAREARWVHSCRFLWSCYCALILASRTRRTVFSSSFLSNWTKSVRVPSLRSKPSLSN